MSHEPPTVFVVDDQDSVRASLCFLLKSHGIRSEAYASAEAFVDAYDPDRPGCVVLDLQMPGMSGLHLLEHLARKGDCRPVIMLTGHGEVATAVRAMQAGAVDFLQKPAAEDELVERIRRSLGIDAQWRHWHRQARGVLQRLNALTARQRQILDLIVDGLTTREIAGRLGESVETVEADRRTLLRRMAARSAVDLARMASLCRGVRGPTGRAA